MRALEAMTIFDRHALVREVRRAIDDRDELVRATANEIAADEKLFELKEELLRTFRRDRSPLVRSTAAVALGDLGVSEASKALRASLRTADDEERVRIYYALAQLGIAEYFDLFLNGLSHDYYRVRCATANLATNIAGGRNTRRIRASAQDALKRETTVAARSSLKGLLQDLDD